MANAQYDALKVAVQSAHAARVTAATAVRDKRTEIEAALLAADPDLSPAVAHKQAALDSAVASARATLTTAIAAVTAANKACLDFTVALPTE